MPSDTSTLAKQATSSLLKSALPTCDINDSLLYNHATMREQSPSPRTPCEYGTCPSDIVRQMNENRDPVKQAKVLAACARALARIIEADDYQMLVAVTYQSDHTPEDEDTICFGPSPCPMMTPYSLEIIK